MAYERIRDLRQDREWNQTQVAQQLQMSQTGYSKYETGENDLPTDVLIRLALLYETAPSTERTQSGCYQPIFSLPKNTCGRGAGRTATQTA